MRDGAVLVFLPRTRGGFVALSPISPQDMFLQPLPHSREEKEDEEEEEEEYRSPYHPYHHPPHHHLHLHTLVTSEDLVLTMHDCLWSRKKII